MKILLANAYLWPALLLLAVPLLLHLFARAKPPPYEFSTVDFILRSLRFTMRLRRPIDLLLLLVRTLLAAALVLLFLKPRLFSDRRFAFDAAARDVVLVVDATASMAYADGAQTRFALARAEASAVLAGLRGGDRAALVWLKAQPASATPELGINRDYLQDSLRRARVTSEHGDVRRAWNLACSLFVPGERRRELVVISDFQRTMWKDFGFVAPEGIQVVAIRVGQGPGENMAITRMRVAPPRPLVNEEIELGVEVANFSGVPRSTPVYFALGNLRRHREVRVAAWSRAWVPFTCRLVEPGQVVASATLPEDHFPGDDQRWIAPVAQARLKVGFAGDATPANRLWLRALDALEWVETENIPVEALGRRAPPDILFLAADETRSSSNRAAITNWLAGGTALAWIPQTAEAAALLEFISGRPAWNAAANARFESGSQPRSVRVTNRTSPVLDLFARGDFGEPGRGIYTGRLLFPTAVSDTLDVILEYDDGQPFLAALKTAPGRAFLWNVALAPEHSNLARQNEFLPLLGEMLLASRNEPTTRQYGWSYPGDHILWPVGMVAAATVTIDPPQGSVSPETIAVRAVVDGYAAGPVPAPGVYTWLLNGERSFVSCVNFPDSESDLRPLETIGQGAAARGVALKHGADIGRLQRGIDLWPLLLTAAVVFILFELLLINLVDTPRKEMAPP